MATLNHFGPDAIYGTGGGESLQGDGIFKVTRTETGVRAEKTLNNGLSIIKDFALSSNYVVQAHVRLENHNAQALNLPATLGGGDGNPNECQ